MTVCVCRCMREEVRGQHVGARSLTPYMDEPSPVSSHLPRGRVFKTERFLKDISYGDHKTWPTMSHQVMVSEVEESLYLGQDGVTGVEGAIPLPEVF